MPDHFCSNLDQEFIENLNKPLSHYTQATVRILINDDYASLPPLCKDNLFKDWKAKWLLKFRNSEHRMLLIRILGYKK